MASATTKTIQFELDGVVVSVDDPALAVQMIRLYKTGAPANGSRSAADGNGVSPAKAGEDFPQFLGSLSVSERNALAKLAGSYPNWIGTDDLATAAGLQSKQLPYLFRGIQRKAKAAAVAPKLIKRRRTVVDRKPKSEYVATKHLIEKARGELI